MGKRQRMADGSPNEIDDDGGKKSRGRPRVDGQDETAADRRRTQIRLAQRAYRQRKENTIATLREQVSSLQATIDEMNKSFLSFNDRVVESGAVHTSNDLGKLLRDTTEHFIQLARNASHSSSGESGDSEPEAVHTETALSSTVVPADRNDLTLQDVPSHQGKGVHIGLGYYELLEYGKELTPPALPSDVNFGTMQMDATPQAELDHNNPHGDFILLPFTSAASESTLAPTISSFAIGPPTPPPIPIFPGPAHTTTLPAPYTFSIDEKTFARRLHRAAVERAFHLLATSTATRPQAIHKIFRLSLMYHTPDMMRAKLKSVLMKDTTEPLEFFHTPFIHLGGAGTHYSKGRIHNGYIIKPGPLPSKSRLMHVDTGIDPGFDVDVDLNMDEYAGTWFDANDVEGFLEEQGVLINPQETFAEADLPANSMLLRLIEGGGSVTEIPELESPGRNQSTSSGSPNTPPPPPEVSNETLELSTMRLFPELSSTGLGDLGWGTSNAAPEFSSATGWLMGSGDKTPDFLNSAWNSVENSGSWSNDPLFMEAFQPPTTAPEAVSAAKTRRITIDVEKFIDDVIRRAICLGRAPGFRKNDIIAGLTSSVIAVV